MREDKIEVVNLLRRLMPDIRAKFHVKRIGYFGLKDQEGEYPGHEMDLLVEFSKPVGWKFFELEEYLEFKLKRKVDITTAQAIHADLREHVLSTVVYI